MTTPGTAVRLMFNSLLKKGSSGGRPKLGEPFNSIPLTMFSIVVSTAPKTIRRQSLLCNTCRKTKINNVPENQEFSIVHDSYNGLIFMTPSSFSGYSTLRILLLVRNPQSWCLYYERDYEGGFVGIVPTARLWGWLWGCRTQRKKRVVIKRSPACLIMY